MALAIGRDGEGARADLPAVVAPRLVTPSLSRRSLLTASAAAAALTGWPALAQEAGPREPLKDLAARKGVLFGTAVSGPSVAAHDDLTDLVLREAAMIVPESAMKWPEMSGGPDRLDFSAPDRLVAFAEANGLVFRGHCLLWHERLPYWFEKLAAGEPSRAAVVRRVAETVRHYRGRVRYWDVLNGAVNPADKRDDGLRASLLLEKLGANYVDLGFRAAHEADPDADLLYVDDGVEADTPEHDDKRTATLKFLERLVHDDVPVDALGVQGHLQFGRPFSEQKFRRFLKDVADFGLSIQITELDCSDEQAPSDPGVRDRLVAETYARFLAVALDEPALDAVTSWGLSDRDSWLVARDTNQDHVRADGLDQRPLPFDATLRPKPAWSAIADAFRAAPER